MTAPSELLFLPALIQRTLVQKASALSIGLPLNKQLKAGLGL
jgi:hypothetical protein